ncbi:hypothetical protein [Streptomyces sp. MUM 178J]|uniref:hypothetical protein n=1 Tax=Streptomyces sp. MUM 178J TaxID=2791991 RepID=UPI001F040C99|nr:hypothetical protein [Streptomyces sp. MUM 178J]WRQ80442.1 hypothetical protein I3F59_014405 [Streptomyces sp. MUM 178J]
MGDERGERDEHDEHRSEVSDEAWEAFQRDSEGPARLRAPKEPSARARMVTERLRREDEAAARRRGRTRRRARRGGPARAEPEGWRTWTAQRRPGRRRGGPWRQLVWVLLAVVLVLILLNPGGTLGWLGG